MSVTNDYVERSRPCVLRAILLGAASLSAVVPAGTLAQTQDEARSALSPYMNSIPPSTDYLCVGNGPSNRALHPDRAPHTELAEQDGVILFSGAAPQQGLRTSGSTQERWCTGTR